MESMKKKLKLKQSVKDKLSALLLLAVIILSGLAVCLKIDQLNNKKSANEGSVQIAQNNTR